VTRGVAGAILAAAVAVAGAGCEGALGTIQLSIVTAPGADPLAGVTRVRLTLVDPETVVEVDREPDGSFVLELEVTADGTATTIIFEGLAPGGEVVAYGRTASLPLAAADAQVVIYVAAPDSFAEAPVALDPPRTDMGTARLPYGVLWAGGRDDTGTAIAPAEIYNVYFHDLQIGDDLPEPRAGIAAATGVFEFVYLFGGEDETGTPRATFWRFETDVAPGGVYIEFQSDDALARTGATAELIGTEQFLATGTPAVKLDGQFSLASAFDDAPPLDGVSRTLQLSDSAIDVLVAGDGAGNAGAVLYESGLFTDFTNPPAELLRTGHGVALLAGGDALIVGGRDAGGILDTAVRYDRVERRFEVLADFLATPRADAAVATAAGRVVIAGGVDAAGNVVGDAEIFDAATLDPISVQPLVAPRTGAAATPLANGQIVLAGGTDDTGAPLGTIELYTP
jgi:hypothetical protein